MVFDEPAPNQKGFAAQWFACAALVLVLTAAIGAYGMAWLVRAERQPRSAFLPLNTPVAGTPLSNDPDMASTGSINPAGKANAVP